MENIRNVAVIGHRTCGKTILCDAMLFNGNATSRIGSIDGASTISDYTEEEKSRQISISASALHCKWDNAFLFLIDTPGSADFFGEVISALRVCDNAVLVVDGLSGVEVGTAKLWKLLENEGIPALIFVNKLDKENADFYKIVANLVEVFGKKCIPIQFPVGKEKDFSGVVNLLTGKGLDSAPDDVKEKVESYREKLVEAAAETDDSLIEKYLEGATLTKEEVSQGLKKGILSKNVVPILCGSAEKNIGIGDLLDTIATVGPSPADFVDVKDSKHKIVKPETGAPFSALIFKNVTDPFVGQLTYFRVYSGTLNSDSEVLNSTKGHKERFGRLYILQGKEQEDVQKLIPGCIGAVTKLKNTGIGDTFCSPSEKFVFEGIEFPKPVMAFAVHPRAKGDEEKVSNGLNKLAEEDPTLRVVRNVETKELVIEGNGDIHLEVVIERLKNKFDVDVDLSIPKVAYKETVKAKSEGHYKHKKQSGGRGQYAEVFLRLEPKGRGEGCEFVNEIKGGVIPTNFIPSVEKGVNSALLEGVLARYPVVDVKVTVFFGSFHTVDSSDIAFRIAAAKAFSDGMGKASPVLLEPIMNVSVTVSSEYMGDVTGDLNSRRGRILGMEPTGTLQVIKAQAPIAEMFKYSRDLRSMTGGRGTFEMEFSHYEEVPANIGQKIIEAAKKEREE